jgi:hypothetical protein
MIYALITLQVLDLISTYLCLTKGAGTEDAKIMAWLMKKLGLVPALMVSKGIYIAMILIWGHLAHEYAIAILAFFYALTVINNFRILCKE